MPVSALFLRVYCGSIIINKFIYQSNVQVLSYSYSWDRLEIHDGDNVGSMLVGDTYFCGDRIPDVIDSTGHSLLVRFKTDHGIADTGFEIEIDSGRNWLVEIM